MGLSSVAVIANPAKRRWAEAVAAVRSSSDNEPVVVTTTVAEPGRTQARAAVEAGAERIVVCGGDGTVREVAAGVAGSGIPIGVVPIGTANIFARNLGLVPRAVAANAQRAVHGRARPIDLGWARMRLASGAELVQPFLVLAGIGHDAATVLETREFIKSRAGWLAYFESGARHLLHRPVAMEVSVDHREPVHVVAWSVLAGNCPRVPPNVLIFPGARLDDGRLEVLQALVRWPHQWIGIALKGGLRLPLPVPALRYDRGATIVVTPSRPVPAQVDGDAVREVAALTVTLQHRAVQVASALPEFVGR